MFRKLALLSLLLTLMGTISMATIDPNRGNKELANPSELAVDEQDSLKTSEVIEEPKKVEKKEDEEEGERCEGIGPGEFDAVVEAGQVEVSVKVEYRVGKDSVYEQQEVEEKAKGRGRRG